MSKCYLILLVLISLLSCKNEKELDDKELINPTTEKIDEYFSSLSKIGKFNGVIYVENEDKTIMNKAYNLNADPSASTFITTESQFDIHSISKLMAHYLILKLELEGKLNRTQTIGDFIEDFPKGEQITIDMLLHHRSGLPRSLEGIEGNQIDLSSEEIIDCARRQKLLFEPGTDSQYSNVGYELIYQIISIASEKPFAQYLTDELFEKNGMNNSGAHFYTDKNNKNNLAKNHILDSNEIQPIENVLDDESKTARLFSTAHDLQIFLNLLKQEPYASMLKDDRGIIAKDGGSDGVRAQVYSNLNQDYDFILLTNYEGIPFLKTIDDFVKILEGEPYEVPKALDRKSIILPDETLEKYVGFYHFPDMGIDLSIKVENHVIVVYQDEEKVGTLKAENENTFFEDHREPESFEFVKNEEGEYELMMGWKGVKLKGQLK